MKIENGMTSESSEVIKENLKYLRKLKEIFLTGKNKNKTENEIGDNGCAAIFNNFKYLSNLEVLEFGRRICGNGCGITSESSDVIGKNMNYLRNLKELNLSRKNILRIENKIGDKGCIGILHNAKYLTKLEQLYLWGKKE